MKNYPQEICTLQKRGFTFLPFFTTFFGIIREKRVSIKFRTFFAF